MTRKTFLYEIAMGVNVEWANLGDGADCTKWNLIFKYRDGSERVEFLHWRGNTTLQAQNQLAERLRAEIQGMVAQAKAITLKYDQGTSAFAPKPADTSAVEASASYDGSAIDTVAAALKREAKDLDKREDAIKKREVELMVQQKQLDAAGPYQQVRYHDPRTGLPTSDVFPTSSARRPLYPASQGLSNPLYVARDYAPADVCDLALKPTEVISGQCIQIASDTDSQAEKPTGEWTLSPEGMTQLKAKMGKSIAAARSISQTPDRVTEQECVQIEPESAGDNSHCAMSKVYNKAKVLTKAFDEEIAARSLQKAAGGMPVSARFDRFPPTSDINNSSAQEPGVANNYWAKMKANNAKETSKAVENKVTAVRQPLDAAQFGYRGHFRSAAGGPGTAVQKPHFPATQLQAVAGGSLPTAYDTISQFLSLNAPARGGIDHWSKIDGNKKSSWNTVMPVSNAPMPSIDPSYSTAAFGKGNTLTRWAEPPAAEISQRANIHAAEKQTALDPWAGSPAPLRFAQTWADRQHGGVNPNTPTASFNQAAVDEEDTYASGDEHGNDDEHCSDHENDDDAYGSGDEYCTDQGNDDDEDETIYSF